MLTATIKGEQVNRAFGKLSAISFRPVLARFGEYVKSAMIAKAFNDEADPVTGTKWQKTSAFTLSLRPGGGTDGKTLRDTGRLFQAYMAIKPKVGDFAVELSQSGVKYAAIHQYGGTIRAKNPKGLAIPLNRAGKRQLQSGSKVKGAKIGFKNSVVIPARPFLGFSEKVKADLSRMIAAHIREVAR